jgi:polyisoprenoid-binding protein YceI
MRQEFSMSFDRPSSYTRVLSLRLILLAFGIVASSAAAERTIILDPEVTQVSFVLQATGHQVRGDLKLLAGELRLEPEDARLVGEIVLDATSAETGNKKRDRAMHRKVLESEGNPRIVLRPERFEGDLGTSGHSVINLFGTISLCGDEHPLAIEVTVEIDGDRFSAESAFSIPYVEWGLRDPSVLFIRVAKSVAVTVRTEGRIQAESKNL